MIRGRSLGSVLFQRAKGSQRAKAKACHVAESTVSRWISGEKKPTDYQQRVIIERGTGVPAGTWDLPYSQAALERHLASGQVMKPAR